MSQDRQLPVDPELLGRPRPSPLHQASVGAGVTEALREMIFDGRLEAGQRVPQDEIARELGVSRLPVREAINSLERDGLVTVEKHRGAYVEAIRREDIRDHYEIFGQIHGIAAARAASRTSPEQLARLRAIGDAMRSTEDETRLQQLNWEFHRDINVAGGSRRLQSIILGLTRQIPRSFRSSIPTGTPQALAEHDAIVDAIEAGDGEAAAAACVAHLRSEASAIESLLTERGFFTEPDE